jgi:hypothetical protein
LPAQLRYTMDQYLWFCFWLENDLDRFKTETYTTVFFRRHAQSKTSNSLNDIIFNHLGKVFFNEHNLVLWSYFEMAAPHHASVIADYFWEGYDYRNNRIAFPVNVIPDVKVAETLFHSYLFELLKEDYRHGFLERMNRNMRYLSKDFLSAEDRSHLKRMRYRSVQPGIIRAYRSLYWKLKKMMERE